MPDDREETARRALIAMSKRDLPAVQREIDPEFELHPLITVWQGIYRGEAGLEQWWRDLTELWEEFTMDAESFRELEDGRLLAKLHWAGRPRGNAPAVEGPAAAIIRFRGARVLKATVYLDEGSALAAAKQSIAPE